MIAIGPAGFGSAPKAEVKPITSYWDGNGRYQSLYEQLNERIPSMGACEDARGRNRALDKMRRAANCYYDLFNNGLCNRAAEFRRVFGFGGKAIADTYHYNRDCYLMVRLEAAMDEIILTAAFEQHLSFEQND